MAPSYLAAEILQLAELHLAVLGRLSETFKEWTIEWLFQWPKTQESDYWPVTKIMSNLATHLTKLESVIVSTLRRPASLCDESCSAVNVWYHQPIYSAGKILNCLSKTMHSAASLRKKGKTLSLPLHARSKHMGRRKVLLGQGIF